MAMVDCLAMSAAYFPSTWQADYADPRVWQAEPARVMPSSPDMCNMLNQDGGHDAAQLPIRVPLPMEGADGLPSSKRMPAHEGHQRAWQGAARSSQEGPQVNCLDEIEKTPGPVTLILRNIPSRCVSSHLLEAIEGSGWCGTFEFLYLPMKSPQANQNRGYAFVGFQDPEQASTFCAALNGARFNRVSSKQIYVEIAKEHRSLHELLIETKAEAWTSKFGCVLSLNRSKGWTESQQPEGLLPMSLLMQL